MRRRRLANRLVLLGSLVGAMLLAAAGIAVAAGEYGAECTECHEETFAEGIHSKVAYYGEERNCETCHSGAAEHAKSEGDAAVVSPGKVDGEKASEICLDCHSKDKAQMFWKGSVHESQELGCTSCHAVHGGRENLMAASNQMNVCFTCHFDVRADLFKRSKHPMRDSSRPSREGKMTCSLCHNPHGAPSEPLIDAASINDKCYECHYEKRAPVLWEHTPVKEDCMTCHTPHGSSVNKLLVTRVPRLCQECHMQGRHQSGTLGVNSVFVFNRGCLNCHSQVHGSNSPSGAILQR